MINVKGKKLAKNAIYNIIYRVINVIFPLISSSYVARVLLPTGVGKVAYAQNIMSYFVLIALLGLPTYGLREVAKIKNNRDLRNKVFNELFVLNFVSTSFCVAIYLLLIFNVSRFQADIPLYLIVGISLVSNIFNIDWFYQGIEEYGFITTRSIIIKIVSLILLFLFVKEPKDYYIYAGIIVFSISSNYILNIIQGRHYVYLELKNLDIKRHIKSVLYLLMCTISTELYSKIDITMLGNYCEDSIIGYYNNAQKVVNVVISIVVSITYVFLPRLSALFESSKEKFNLLVNWGFRLIALISFPCMCGLCAVAEEITIVLFGIPFLSIITTIRILSMLILIKGIGDLLTYQVIVSSGNEKKLLLPYVFAAIANIVLNVILIPRYFQNGAAFASVISELIVFLMLFPTAIRTASIEKPFLQMWRIVVSTFIMVIAIRFTKHIICSVFLKLLIKVAVGIVVYGSCLIILKEPGVFYLVDEIKKKKKRI